MDGFSDHIQLPDNLRELTTFKIEQVIEEIKAWRRLTSYSDNPMMLTTMYLSKIQAKARK